MLPSALAGPIDNFMRADLEHWRGFWFEWLLISSAIVALGVALEFPEVLHDITHVVRRRSPIFRCIFPKYDDPMGQQGYTPDWIRLIAFVGLILVVTGVIGEGITEAFISDADGNLQAFSNAMLADAQKEAALAIERAAANEKEAAQLRKDAASEHLARVKIEQNIAWRRLASDEREQLSAQVTQFAGTAALIEYGPSDTEAYAFGVDIAKSLSLAHWQASDPHPVLQMMAGPFAFGTSLRQSTGVEIGACPNDPSRKAAKGLRDALVALGFDAAVLSTSCESLKNLQPSVPNPIGMLVWIRPRPEGPQGQAKLKGAHLGRR